MENQNMDLEYCIEMLGDVISVIPKEVKKVNKKIDVEISKLTTKIDSIKLQKGDKGDSGEKGLKGDDGLDGLDGSPDTPKEIANKLNTLEDIIDWKVLKDFKSLVNQDTLKSAIQTLENQTRFLIQSNANRSSTGGSGTVTSISTAGLISGGTITTTGTITTEMADNKLVGNDSGGIGVMQEIGIGTRMELSGGNLNWIPTTYVVRNTTGNIDNIEEYTVCTTATGVELTLPTCSGTGGQRHTIINRDVTGGLKISGTGGDGFGNKDVVSTIFIGPGETMTFISDNVNTWLYQQDRTMYDEVVPTVTAVSNLITATIETMYVWRVGNEVCFRGEVLTNPIANNTQCIFNFTVPLYNGANFIAVSDAGVVGIGTDSTATPAHSISGRAVIGGNVIECSYFETHGAQDTIVFTGSYRWRP